MKDAEICVKKLDRNNNMCEINCPDL